MENVYRSTQFGTVIVASLVGSAIFTVALSLLTYWHPVATFIVIILLLCAALFHSLTIEINASELRCFFGFGIVSKRFPLSEIAAAVPVRNRWYYGWGIRLSLSGWMFNVSGLEAIELRLKSGIRFRIGTDKSQEVADVINRLKSGSI